MIRRCARCEEEKPLDADHFPIKLSRKSMYRGICSVCWDLEHPPPPPPKVFHPKKLWAMCGKKQAFKSEQSARNVMIKHALKHKGQRVGIYQCPACQKWHVTTHPR